MSREAHHFKGANRFYSVAFSPDGRLVAATAARIDALDINLDAMKLHNTPLVTVWDATSGQQIYTIPLNDAAAAFCAAFSPDGEWLAIAIDNRETPVKIFSAANGKEAVAFKGHTGAARSLAFNSDGKRLFTGSQDGTARIWDAATGKELFTLPRQASWINGVAFNPDGMSLATCTIAGTVKVWDATTGQELSTLTTGQNKLGLMDCLHNVTFSPDGALLAAATMDTTEHGASTVRVWELASGKVVHNLHGDYIAFSRDGTRLATATARVIKIYDLASGQEILALRGHVENVFSVAFSPDGKRLASTSLDRTTRVWNIGD